MFHPHMIFSKDISNSSPVKSRIYFEDLIQNDLLYLHFRKGYHNYPNSCKNYTSLSGLAAMYKKFSYNKKDCIGDYIESDLSC